MYRIIYERCFKGIETQKGRMMKHKITCIHHCCDLHEADLDNVIKKAKEEGFKEGLEHARNEFIYNQRRKIK